MNRTLARVQMMPIWDGHGLGALPAGIEVRKEPGPNGLVVIRNAYGLDPGIGLVWANFDKANLPEILARLRPE